MIIIDPDHHPSSYLEKILSVPYPTVTFRKRRNQINVVSFKAHLSLSTSSTTAPRRGLRPEPRGREEVRGGGAARPPEVQAGDHWGRGRRDGYVGGGDSI